MYCFSSYIDVVVIGDDEQVKDAESDHSSRGLRVNRHRHVVAGGHLNCC